MLTLPGTDNYSNLLKLNAVGSLLLQLQLKNQYLLIINYT